MRTRTRVAGVVGLVIALIMIFASPVIQILAFRYRVKDRSWRMARSEDEVWLEVQKFIRRSGWFSGAWLYVGACGDEEWAQWTIENLLEWGGGARSDTYRCDQELSLMTMTNHDPLASGIDWPAWWQSNRGKTQETWIRDGFRASGLTLSDPLSRKDIRDLLERMADTSKLIRSANNTDRAHAQLYNAFRWLRDSGFQPGDLSMDDLQGPEADRVLAGYGLYCSAWESRWTEWMSDLSEAGRLDLPSIKRRRAPDAQSQESSQKPAVGR